MAVKDARATTAAGTTDQGIPVPPVKLGALQAALETALSASNALETTPAVPGLTPRLDVTTSNVQDRDASSPPAIPTSPGETRRTAIGRISKILPDRGFAFIADEATTAPWAGIEYFLHRSMIGNEAFQALALGQRVRFDAVFSNKGWRALRIFAVPTQEVG
jgi:cold shock CspA family protein